MKSSHLTPLFLAILALIVAGLACNAPTPTPSAPNVIVITATPLPPTIAPPPTDPPPVVPTNPPEPTNEPPPQQNPPSNEPSAYFTEEFDNGSNNWSYFLTKGDDSDLNLYANKGMLTFDINGKDVWAYAMYEPYYYDDVRIDAEATNRGANDNYFTMICRYDENKGWYEFNINNGGLYSILFGQWKAGQNGVAYAELYSGGSTAIRMGMVANEFTVICQGDKLSLYINGTKVRTVSSEWGLQKGLIGIGASSFQHYPVAVDYEWVSISAP